MCQQYSVYVVNDIERASRGWEGDRVDGIGFLYQPFKTLSLLYYKIVLFLTIFEKVAGQSFFGMVLFLKIFEKDHLFFCGFRVV